MKVSVLTFKEYILFIMLKQYILICVQVNQINGDQHKIY